MSSYVPSTGPRPSDRFIPWIFVGMFVVLTAVLGLFTYLAQSTYPGVVTENAYKKGLAFNAVLAEQAAQEKLGWQADVAVSKADRMAPARLHLTLKDKAGKPVEGAQVRALFFFPAHAGQDVEVMLKPAGTGVYEAEASLPRAGLWDVRLTAEKDGSRLTKTERTNLP